MAKPSTCPPHAGLYFGLGVAAGSAVGGHVYQRYGAQAVYLVACAVLAAGWLLCGLAQLVVQMLRQPLAGGARYERVAAVQLGERPGELDKQQAIGTV